jgi:hypothetical protein
MPSLLAGFGLSLVLVWCVAAYTRGRRLYGIAAIGVAMALLGWMARDYAPPAELILLQATGLVLFAAILGFDLLTEEVSIDTGAPPPGGGSEIKPPL